MKEFKSPYSFYSFYDEVRRNNRFFRSEESQAFLDAVIETCSKRALIYVANKALWRAQLGCEWRPEGVDEYPLELPYAYGLKRMIPQAEKSGDGRLNPRKIAYLYTATDVETAIAEVRPWVGAYVSIGHFRSVRDLNLIDCSKDFPERLYIYSEDASADQKEKSVWGCINQAFSSPVGPEDDYAAYIPTQIIAELFKVNGFDGIIFRSSLGPGQNICLFNLDAAKMVIATLYKVKGVKYNFSEEEQ
jgi:hypothetical protein